ncbi:Transposase, variant 2 [Balamuthia mandrillaris]
MCHPFFDPQGLSPINNWLVHLDNDGQLQFKLFTLSLEPLVTMFKHFDQCHSQVLHQPLVTGIIDTTECPVQRSMNADTQHTFYSGKKKQHTVKYELVGLGNGALFLGQRPFSRRPCLPG